MCDKKLVIKSIGPIKFVDINLNKVNVFIGAQGSGKSTIAKIISYMTWVEKQLALNRDIDYFTKDNTFYEKLVTFHKLHGYFSDGEFKPYDSMISYESDIVSVLYNHNDGVSITLKNIQNYKRVKISYIPSERNIVSAIPNWFDVKLSDNNILSFMSDWEIARKKMLLSSPMSLMSGKVNYHYEEPNRDIVVFENNIELEMTNTASGFQSMIPLFVVCEYAARLIYKEETSDIATIEKNKNITNQIVTDYLENQFPSENILSILDRLKKDLNGIVKGESSPYVEALRRAKELVSNFTQTNVTSLIIEEPEQNLFPETQRDVLYDLFKLASDDKVSLTLTTHSPYILYAINNCIMGGLVKDVIPAEVSKTLRSKPYWIESSKVSIFQISDEGEVDTIQNDKTNTLKNQYLNDAMNEVMNEYFIMLKYLR